MRKSNKELLLDIINNMLERKVDSKEIPLLITYPELVKEIRNLLNELIADKSIGYGKTLNDLFVTTKESLNKQKEIES